MTLEKLIDKKVEEFKKHFESAPDIYIVGRTSAICEFLRQTILETFRFAINLVASDEDKERLKGV